MNMLRHVLSVMGMIEPWSATRTTSRARSTVTTWWSSGPGPGDPRDAGHPKIAAYRNALEALLGSTQPFLAVCLGHQVLCGRLGIPLAYKDIVFQGTQSRVDLRGREEVVGFYNTFVGRVRDHDGARRGRRSPPTRRPATSTWSPARTSAGCSSMPSRSSPSTATT